MRHERWRQRLWIVDGHNAIFALPDLCRLQTQAERRAARGALEAMVRPFALRLHQPLCLVYDGNQIERNPEAGESGGLRILFSQPPEEADDRIVFLASQALARGMGVTVVTNDRRSLASRLPRGAIVLAVEEFRDRWLLGPAPAVDAAEEKRISDRDRREIEQTFQDREDEIQERARRGARGREREQARRWQARTGNVPPEVDGEALEPQAWPAREVPSGPRKASVAAPPSRPAGAAAPPGSPVPGRSTEAREAREARRRRGQRKQQRRLEQLRRKQGRDAKKKQGK